VAVGIVSFPLDELDLPDGGGRDGRRHAVRHRAVTRAGVRAMALRYGGSHDAELHGAGAIYDDPASSRSSKRRPLAPERYGNGHGTDDSRPTTAPRPHFCELPG